MVVSCLVLSAGCRSKGGGQDAGTSTGLPYRPNVGIVVFNKEGLTLVGERLDHLGEAHRPVLRRPRSRIQFCVNMKEHPTVCSRLTENG